MNIEVAMWKTRLVEIVMFRRLDIGCFMQTVNSCSA